jgi:hypothetical protein
MSNKNSLKNISRSTSISNLIDSHNDLSTSISNLQAKNFIKNDSLDFIIKNDDTYNYSELLDSDTIDKTKFSISNWFSSSSTNNSDCGINLNNTTLGTIDKEDLKETISTPILLNTTTSLYQEFELNLEKQSYYTFVVKYKIFDVDNIPQYLQDNNLTFTLNINVGGVYVSLPSASFEINNTDFINSNSLDYEYTKTFTLKNLNTYYGIYPFKITFNGSTNDIAYFDLSTIGLYKGALALNGLMKQDNLLNSIRFNENKNWEITKDGVNYFPLLNKNIILVGDGGNYTTLDDAIDSNLTNTVYSFCSDVNLTTTKTLPLNSVILGNGYTLSISSGAYLQIQSTNSEDNIDKSGIINLTIEGGIYSVQFNQASDCFMENVICKNILSTSSVMIRIADSYRINLKNITINNDNSFANNSLYLYNCDDCHIQVNSILKFGYASGTNHSGSAIYLSNSNHNTIAANKITAEIEKLVETGTIKTVELLNSLDNNITVNYESILQNDESVAPIL